MNYQEAYEIRVTDYKNNVRNCATISDCVANELPCRATIIKLIKNKSKANDGRILHYLLIFFIFVCYDTLRSASLDLHCPLLKFQAALFPIPVFIDLLEVTC